MLRFTYSGETATGTLTIKEGVDQLHAFDLAGATGLAIMRYAEDFDRSADRLDVSDVHIDVVEVDGKYAVEFSGDCDDPDPLYVFTAFAEFISILEDLIIEEAAYDEEETVGPLDLARGWQAPREDIEA